tara:strand:- start:170 stop:406 length:237 start_codon:yes stop_codon:yes gene_type:complete
VTNFIKVVEHGFLLGEIIYAFHRLSGANCLRYAKIGSFYTKMLGMASEHFVPPSSTEARLALRFGAQKINSTSHIAAL